MRLEVRRDALDALHNTQEVPAREARKLEAVPAALVHLRDLEGDTVNWIGELEDGGGTYESGVFGDVLEALGRALDAVVVTSEADATDRRVLAKFALL